MNPIQKTSFSYILNNYENQSEQSFKKARINETSDMMNIASEEKSTSIDDLTENLLNQILSIVSRSTSSVQKRLSGMESALCTSKKWSIEAAKIKKCWFEKNDISFLSYKCTTAKDVLKCAVEKELNVLHLWDRVEHNITQTAETITDDELNHALRKLPNLQKLTVSSNALTTLDLSQTTKLENLSIIHPKNLSTIILNKNLTNLKALTVNGINQTLVINLLQFSPNLTSLTIVDNKCEDRSLIEEIASHKKLEHLRFNAFYSPTFQPLETLTNMEALYFCDSNVKANELKVILASMPKIFHLQITLTPNITDKKIFDIVSKFPQLESLHQDSGFYEKVKEMWYREETSDYSDYSEAEEAVDLS